ncbi:MAG: type II toxin-antitoxin system RelE/ParE family toxin [Planctomycetes bacterium]|nr:type II toxin-antitoxin system RelE/ParE family toxin [Planctomycetota bacterium]
MYSILINKKSSKYYERLSDNTALKVNKALEKICSNPFRGFHIKKLVGKLEGKYRYEMGDLRIVYSVDENKKIVFVEAIGPRGDVYK